MYHVYMCITYKGILYLIIRVLQRDVLENATFAFVQIVVLYYLFSIIIR